jgi:acyl-CoA reductase-like NAD-dependent aldehyde dehydrogenase
MTTKPHPNPYGPEVKPQADGAPAIPLWIGGRAYLTMPRHGFFDLFDASGAILRRVPRCGADAVEAAVAAAQSAAAAGWPPGTWESVVDKLADSLARYADHLARLLSEESAGAVDGEAEVASLAGTLAAMRGSAAQQGGRGAGVVAVIASMSGAFAVPAMEVLAALAGGRTLVVRPALRAPSALLALAEMLTRAGLPAGRLNVVHGDDEAVAALCTHPQVKEIACAGAGEPVCEAAARLATEAGKPFRSPG